MSAPTIRAALERLVALDSTIITMRSKSGSLAWAAALAAARPALSSGDGLSAKEVEAQDAFTQMRDEILSLSDGVEVNEVLGIIDNHTPEWV